MFFRRFMLFGFGGLAIAAALAFTSASTIAGYQPAFDNVITFSSDRLDFSVGFADAAFKAVHEERARAALNEGAGLGQKLNRAPTPNIYSAAIAPTSVSGWRSGRVRTLAAA